MARFPGARWDPLPENEWQDPIEPTQVILHTAVDQPGPTRLERYFARADVNVESHLWITLEGEAVQMMDTEIRADANRYANRRPDGSGALSVETEDEGNPVGVPWSPEQLEKILEFIFWAHEEHGIPLEVCSNPSAPGIGYHSLFGAPSSWTPSRGKTCPGSTRIAQFYSVIVPAMEAYGRETGMGKEEARQKAALLYAGILGRPGDPGGLEFWATQGEGQTELWLLWAFIGSAQKELEQERVKQVALSSRVKALEEFAARPPRAPAMQTIDVDAITEAVASRLSERLSPEQ